MIGYYVYKLTHPTTGEYYYGSRMSYVLPVEKDVYFGSGTWPRHMKKVGIRLTKEILYEFSGEFSMRQKERELILREDKTGLCRNIKREKLLPASKGFKTVGITIPKDIYLLLNEVALLQNRSLSAEIVLRLEKSEQLK